MKTPAPPLFPTADERSFADKTLRGRKPAIIDRVVEAKGVDLKIFLTADVHLGMKFAGFPGVQRELSEARFGTLRRTVELANAEGCNLFVVAGDLFDRVSVPAETVVEAASILEEFQGELVAVLPGNHDFHAPGSDRLWREFESRHGDRTLLLAERRAYPLAHYNLNAVLYPAPCEGKHSELNAVCWVRETRGREPGGPDGGAFHVGVAHGSLSGVSPDFDQRYYPMTREELSAAGLDVWLLGHTHSRFPGVPGQADRVFYPGTPEPDGFDCAHEGGAWVILLESKPRAALSARAVSTGRYRFVRRRVEVAGADDMDRLLGTLASGGPELSPERTLLKLSLAGRIPRAHGRSVASLEEEIAKAVFYLHRPLDVSGLREEITGDDISREFSEHSFPHRLLSALSAAGDHEALQIAYDMIREARR
jgi:DNA repair exonuclease SbcCD nuclease subunit